LKLKNLISQISNITALPKGRQDEIKRVVLDNIVFVFLWMRDSAGANIYANYVEYPTADDENS
jgi:hypothetical protein